MNKYHLALGLCLLLFTLHAHAHKTRPTIISISFEKSGVVNLELETNIEALLARIGPDHKDTDNAPEAEVYNNLRGLSSDDLTTKFKQFSGEYEKGLNLYLSNLPAQWQLLSVEIGEVGDTRVSRKSVVYYRASIPTGVTSAKWTYDKKYGDAVVKFISEGKVQKLTYWLPEGKQSPIYPLDKAVVPRTWFEVALDYTQLGYIHILPRGLDHILFVLGLALLSTQLGPLLWQVTAFTVAHSITLALSIYGLISLPGSIVEPLIALSIAYVGIENVFSRKLKASRIIIVFLFGLLHGMGFAGVLLELGLPESEFVVALITFNVGVEFGQLSVILLAFIAVGWLRHREKIYRKFVVIPGSLFIAFMGLYWTWERISPQIA